MDLVREALTEMTQRRILAEMKPYDERLTHATTKGRPKIVEAVWMLYPSAEFVDEVVIGNRQMSCALATAGGNMRESLFQGRRPGEISAKDAKKPGETGAKLSIPLCITSCPVTSSKFASFPYPFLYPCYPILEKARFPRSTSPMD